MCSYYDLTSLEVVTIQREVGMNYGLESDRTKGDSVHTEVVVMELG